MGNEPWNFLEGERLGVVSASHSSTKRLATPSLWQQSNKATGTVLFFPSIACCSNIIFYWALGKRAREISRNKRYVWQKRHVFIHYTCAWYHVTLLAISYEYSLKETCDCLPYLVVDLLFWKSSRAVAVVSLFSAALKSVLHHFIARQRVCFVFILLGVSLAQNHKRLLTTHPSSHYYTHNTVLY